MGLGYDRLARDELAARGVKSERSRDYGTTEVADYAVALALALRRGILLHHDLLRRSPPAPWQLLHTPMLQRPQGPPPAELILADPPPPPTPRTFSILGLGRIDAAVALRTRAFGWCAPSTYLKNGIERALPVARAPSVEALFRQSHTVSIHTPAAESHQRAPRSLPVVCRLEYEPHEKPRRNLSKKLNYDSENQVLVRKQACY